MQSRNQREGRYLGCAGKHVRALVRKRYIRNFVHSESARESLERRRLKRASAS